MDRSGQRGNLYRYFSTLIDFIQSKPGNDGTNSTHRLASSFSWLYKKCSSEITIVFSIPGHVFLGVMFILVINLTNKNKRNAVLYCRR